MQNNENETKSNEITKIYLVENCYNNSNKVYIGKTKNNNKNRFYSHISKFGKNIQYSYIDEINSIDKKDWKPIECYWIEQFKAWGFEVVNKNKGGGGCEFATEEMKLKISNKNKGKEGYWKTRIRSEETKQKMRKPKNHGKKISKSKTGYKYNWKKQYHKPVLQYDLQGNFIKEWYSGKEINLKLKIQISDISACCNNKQKTAGSYIWKFKIIQE